MFQSPGKMAKYIHDSLAAIFKKIGSRENSKEVIIVIMWLYYDKQDYIMFYV